MGGAGVMIVAEWRGGRLAPTAGELATVARRVAEQLKGAGGFSAVILGSNVGDAAQELVALGASTVFVVEDPQLAGIDADAIVEAMDQVCRQVCPSLVLFRHTSFSSEVAPRLAVRLRTVSIPDCLDIHVDPTDQQVYMVRPVYGGNAIGTFVAENGRPAIATLRKKVHAPSAPDPSRQGRIVKLDIRILPETVRTKRVQVIQEDPAGIRLEDATVVIGGGRGIGGAEGFGALEELAKELGGAVGASRAAIDAEWIASSKQIGQTGKTISPDIYIAVGISGAMQHMAGALSAKTIVAINHDADAPIFKMAHFGVVADWREVLPAFLRELKVLRHDS